MFREKIYGIQWAAIIIEFAGVLVLTLIDGVFSINVGLLWLIFAALLLSIYNLLQRLLTKSYTALQSSTFSIFFGTILLAIFLPASVKEISRAPGIQLVYIAVLGIFSSAIAYVSWSKAFAKARQTSQVSNYMFITPFITSILGYLIAGEIPDRATVIMSGYSFRRFCFNLRKIYGYIKSCLKHGIFSWLEILITIDLQLARKP